VNSSIQIKIEDPVLVLIGPTAIGKTALSLELAERFGCEIVSVDSMQVYRYMDIGTAKPSREERARVVHHLIDIIDPDEQFDAAQFFHHALAAIESIRRAGRVPLLTGGTGMYLKALFQGLFDHETMVDDSIRTKLAKQLAYEGNEKLYEQLKRVDPESAARIHPNDTQRLLRALEIYEISGTPWSQHLQEQTSPTVQFEKIIQIGLTCDRQLLYERIEERSGQMIRAGLVPEVERLRKMGYTSELSSMQAIGYRHVNNFLDGVWDMDETMRLLIRDTRRYAKRQMTWFGGDPTIEWHDRSAAAEIVQTVEKWLHDN